MNPDQFSIETTETQEVVVEISFTFKVDKKYTYDELIEVSMSVDPNKISLLLGTDVISRNPEMETTHVELEDDYAI